MKKRSGSRNGFTYRSYNFVDKDPVIDKVRSLLSKEGLSNSEASVISGVSATTLHNWLEGETRRPQYATVAAVTSSLGYTTKFVRARRVDFGKEIEKAKAEIAEAKEKS